ncbi:MAG: 4-hydroxythreonine-4-phosphate dehydrogenase PdxA [Sphaerochaeta sp.]|nr:4-hydroxythreonine-4-phosphate dehydrogenase PdxA [Sphaerochaeta sp.]
MSAHQRTYLAIPGGDPAGIGGEILLKALSRTPRSDDWGIIVIADGPILQKTATDLGLPFDFDQVVDDSKALKGAIEAGAQHILYALRVVDVPAFRFGTIRGDCGRAAYDALKVAVTLVQQGMAKAIVTPPLHKEALKAAGIDEIGHTEILQTLTASTKAVTMFDTLSLKIFFHSRHLSLRDACDAVTRESLLSTIAECDRITQRNAGFNRCLPLAVAALNPHSSDGGLFGDEETVHIIPAIEDARAEGIDVIGPIGADSVFYQARMGRWRAVISLYHDQGHIAAKTYDFNQTISVTWGLPFLRTSVDHGTAFDIAGLGVADESGMVRAIQAAIEYLGEGI